MSSEYIYERKAITLQGARDTYTALFVKSHSSNDGEHTPRWKVYNLSKKRDAMGHVVRCAHYCDDGLTKGPNGQPLSGQHEIGMWREAVRTACLVTTDAPAKLVDLVFSDKPSATADGSRVRDELLSLASARGVLVQHYSDSSCKHPPHSVVTMDLSVREHVDLVWAAINTIKVPSIYGRGAMVGLGPYKFLRSLTNALNSRHLFPEDPTPLLTQAVACDFDLKESLFKFEFPVDGQAVWKDTRFVVTDWTCRVLSMDPHGWFAEKLAAMESQTPGCAESAYRKFKRMVKASPTTPVEQIGTVEVRALTGVSEAGDDRVALGSLQDWQQDTVKAFFAAHGKQPETEAVYTSSAKGHYDALCLNSYVPCYLAVDALIPF